MHLCLCTCVYAPVFMHLCLCTCVYAPVFMDLQYILCMTKKLLHVFAGDEIIKLYLRMDNEMNMCVCVCVCVCVCMCVCACVCVYVGMGKDQGINTCERGGPRRNECV